MFQNTNFWFCSKLRFRHIEMYFSVSVIRGQCILGTVELPESARVCRQELIPPLLPQLGADALLVLPLLPHHVWDGPQTKGVQSNA